MDEYTTIKAFASDEFTERRSRFIGHVKPAASEAEAAAFIAECRDKYWDASHNVYAYILRDGQTRRYSDDGEPQGTGGVPGARGAPAGGADRSGLRGDALFRRGPARRGRLVRAYSHGAKLAVDAAERMTMSECTELALEFGYDLYGKISYLLPQFHAQTTFSDFGAVVRLQVLVKDCFVPSFEKALAEGTSALVTPRAVDRRYACIPE